MCEFASRLRRYGDRMFENTLPMPTKKLWNDYRDSFRATTKLYLFTHFQALVKHFIGDLYDLLIHAEMMDCVDNGMVDLVTGYRKIGAIIRPDCVNIDPDNGHTKEDTFCAIYNELRISYVKAVIWENVKNPQLVSFQATLTKDLLQRKLDAIIAAYSVGTIREWEKLQELQYITRNEHYTVKQMVDFGNALIELNGVKCYIKDDLAVWCSSNASK